MKDGFAGGVLLALLTGYPAGAVAADDLRVNAGRSGSGVAVSVQAIIKAPRAVIWSTLTDYDHLSDFIPGMKRSRVIGRRGPAAIVEQHGEAALLFVKYPIHVVVESAEHPPGTITINVVRGNLRQLDGRYQIEQGGNAEEHILRWTGVVEPDTVMPSFIAVPLMRISIEDQFVGMVKEIERRTAAQSSREKETHVEGK